MRAPTPDHGGMKKKRGGTETACFQCTFQEASKEGFHATTQYARRRYRLRAYDSPKTQETHSPSYLQILALPCRRLLVTGSREYRFSSENQLRSSGDRRRAMASYYTGTVYIGYT